MSTELPALLDFDVAQRRAKAMAAMSMLPKHFRGRDETQTIANCLMIVAQAERWQMEPMAVAAETYEVRGKLGYQGKLVAAVVNARAGLKNRLNYSFTGSSDTRTVTVYGTFQGEEDARIVQLSVGQAKTENEMWRNDPDQKLCYSGAIRWARRHCPELILGVLTVEELEICRTFGDDRRAHISPLGNELRQSKLIGQEALESDGPDQDD